jgi:PRTRC genetic system protein C
MVTVVELKRVFEYNSIELKDPDINMTPTEVMSFYSNVYPELTQAVIEGPEVNGDTEKYEFRKAVGTKGGNNP